MNSVMFLFNLASMFTISIFNFEGRPFMQSLSENKKHFKFLMAPIALITLLSLNISTDISYFFQTSLQSPKQNAEYLLFGLLFGFIGLSFAWVSAVKMFHYGKIVKLI